MCSIRRQWLNRHMKTLVSVAIISLCLFLMVSGRISQAFTTSFTCSSHIKGYETLVCGSQDLSKADDSLNDAYHHARSTITNNASQARLELEQKNWVKNRLSKCADVPCLAKEYQLRTATLKTYTVSGTTEITKPYPPLPVANTSALPTNVHLSSPTPMPVNLVNPTPLPVTVTNPSPSSTDRTPVNTSDVIIPPQIGINMTQVWYILIAGTPAMMAAVLSFIGIILAKGNRNKMEEIHISINGRMEELLRLTTAAEYAKGKLAGHETNIPGPQGIEGTQGIKGHQGEQGVQGEHGEQGVHGEQGEQGVHGEQGEHGEHGEQGTQGLHGEQGEQGTQGIKGHQGEQGIQGEKGNNHQPLKKQYPQ